MCPFRPPSEQRRIVEILDQADHLRRLRAEADAKADRILPALFVKMFGSPVTSATRWPTRAISQLATVTTGNTPSRDRPEYFGDHIEWVKSDNLNTPSHYVTRAAEGLSKDGADVGRVAPPGSTLITCIAGSPGAIGNAALTDHAVAFNQQINAATPREGVDPYFLYGHFVVGKQLIQAASTGGMKGIVTKSRLSAIEFLSPPLALQERFGRQCKALCDQKEQRLRQATGLDEARTLPVGVKGVVASTVHAALRNEVVSGVAGRRRFGGFSHTEPIGVQSRVWRVQRSGFVARAAWYTA